MLLDDVAADFPDLTIILAHPSFPWQDSALAVATHKPNVYIDLSGWSPKYFPPQLVRYANSLLQDKVLFGSDYPVITPDRWLADFAELEIKDRHPAEDPQGQRDQGSRPGTRPSEEETCHDDTVTLWPNWPGWQAPTWGTPTGWTIDQHRIDRFAAATSDDQWIHTDPVRAENGPFGSTIAHGYLTLSLVVPVFAELLETTGGHQDQLRAEQGPLRRAGGSRFQDPAAAAARRSERGPGRPAGRLRRSGRGRGPAKPAASPSRCSASTLGELMTTTDHATTVANPTADTTTTSSGVVSGPRNGAQVTEKHARQVAEASREKGWDRPSFGKNLYLGPLRPVLIHPHPRPAGHIAERGGRSWPSWRRTAGRWTARGSNVTRGSRTSIWRDFADIGAFGMKIPTEYGGLGLPHVVLRPRP